ncbi:hypothetical protein N7532_009905 [Penicillium argentinense]|uniref:Gamma-butyrobetaine dioxygenase n=1 Tax=Penicillium argentinense TaxID=1131581 RepID=A0A9W9ENW6_9EURO|nr:uncharacterized protein N7532_009905 [Penicillium argentinense]KAJ5085134.1 hypothetical protein N7532_009905 [Penicillium argentinense]
MLRQVARGLAGPVPRTFTSSARRLNSEGAPATQSHMSQLLNQVSRLDATEKQHLLGPDGTAVFTKTLRHPFAGSGPEELSTLEVLKPAKAILKPEKISLRSPAHSFAEFQYHYLRDLCRCPRCVDPHSKQRSFRTGDIPANIYPRGVKWDGVSLEIKWANDILDYGEDHVSRYEIHKLVTGPYNTHDNTSRATKPYLWDNAKMMEMVHWVSFEDYMGNDAKFAESMRNLQRLGLIFVKDIPKSRDLVKKIAERMGPLRNSFYGETWDVRTVPEAKNVAYTNQFLGFHMDLLYMNEPPGYQLLHCLENSCEGGESLFADAFRAAKIMKQQFPAEFKILSTRLIGFEYMHDDHMYSNTRPLFEVDELTREIRNVNYSPPFQGPIPKLDRSGNNNHANFKRWKNAMATFTRLLESSKSVYQLKLNPGECVIFANRRIVHARNHFNTAEGSRWLAGAYVDEDALLSTFATNAKNFPNEWKSSDPAKTGRALEERFANERKELHNARREEYVRQNKTEGPQEQAGETQ